MKLEVHLAGLRKVIDKALSAHLPSGRTCSKAVSDAMRYSVFSGGKRIRPILAIESCVACGGKGADILPAACAVEFVHTYSLIHDDLPAMDDDDCRRGKPTCHKVFGEGLAILAGDALLTLAFNIIAKEFKPGIASRMVRELSEASGPCGMVGGQALDLECKNKDRKTLAFINNLKTAKLFEVSAKLGAIAAGAGEKNIKALAKYGLYTGKAFQIIDDIIDGESYKKDPDMKKARKEGALLTEKAVSALKIFGRKADALKEISGYMLGRAG